MFALIDGEVILDRDGLHDTLAESLGLPEYYGRNLDALYDCLTDYRCQVIIYVQNRDALAAHLGSYADMFFNVVKDAAGENEWVSLEILN